MSIYDRAIAAARRQIEKYGAQTTLTTLGAGNGTYDENTATATPPAPIVDTVTAVVLPVADRLIDGTLIQAGDQIAYLSALGITEPKVGSVLAWRGKSYTTVKAKALAPAGEAVLYELQVRA